MTSTRNRSGHTHAEDLASDLTADLLADMEREQPPAAVEPKRRFTFAASPSIYTVSSKLQLSPSQWARPSFGIAPDGFTTTIGPVHFELFLH